MTAQPLNNHFDAEMKRLFNILETERDNDPDKSFVAACVKIGVPYFNAYRFYVMYSKHHEFRKRFGISKDKIMDMIDATKKVKAK